MLSYLNNTTINNLKSDLINKRKQIRQKKLNNNRLTNFDLDYITSYLDYNFSICERIIKFDLDILDEDIYLLWTDDINLIKDYGKNKRLIDKIEYNISEDEDYKKYNYDNEYLDIENINLDYFKDKIYIPNLNYIDFNKSYIGKIIQKHFDRVMITYFEALLILYDLMINIYLIEAYYEGINNKILEIKISNLGLKLPLNNIKYSYNKIIECQKIAIK